MRLYTIGHSTRTFDELVEALASFGVRLLVDIRTIPRSRHTPQFNRDALARRLPRRGLRYRHLKALGGLRKPKADSRNTAWRNASFRGFADYMETQEFADAIQELRKLAREEGPAAMMCAEAVPWRCHRSLVADALTARGDTVVHIMTAGKGHPHEMTPWAKVDGAQVTYPGPPPPTSPRAHAAVTPPASAARSAHPVPPEGSHPSATSHSAATSPLAITPHSAAMPSSARRKRSGEHRRPVIHGEGVRPRTRRGARRSEQERLL